MKKVKLLGIRLPNLVIFIKTKFRVFGFGNFSLFIVTRSLVYSSEMFGSFQWQLTLKCLDFGVCHLQYVCSHWCQ